MLSACVLMSPLLCLLLHAGHQGRWPGSPQRTRGSHLAPVLALVLLAGLGVALTRTSGSLALGLTLPLAALSCTGMGYVACVQTWPRSTRTACLMAAALAPVTLTTLGD